MEKEDIQKALAELKQQPKKKFTQSYDLIINLKSMDVKQHPVDFFVNLPHPKGPKVKVAAFCDQQLAEQAQKNCEGIIKDTEFDRYKDKKLAKKLAEQYDFFLAQANLMPKVAAVFGKALGTKGKMPNPKLGCVVLPTANLAPLIKKLDSTIRCQAKKALNLQCMIGKENQSDEEIIENILAVYHGAVKQLPNETQNVKNVALKLTMGRPVKVW